ncbi:histone-lysine N-methyltransferase SETMAR [Trichonephila clavipes]|nr:histone-lysine N-methyltransferase SETMAR [Trichonephila clavipes]
MRPRKIMLCVWWTCRQVVHYELLPTGQTVPVDLHSQQLERVQLALHQKELALTLCHPPYSPDFAPSSYHLFHSLDNHLRGKSLTNEEDVRQALMDFFASHTSEFYRKRIEQLETRWQKVLDADDDCFEDSQ